MGKDEILLSFEQMYNFNKLCEYCEKTQFGELMECRKDCNEELCDEAYEEYVEEFDIEN